MRHCHLFHKCVVPPGCSAADKLVCARQGRCVTPVPRTHTPRILTHPHARLTALGRQKLVTRHLDEYVPLAELACQVGISLRTTYKDLRGDQSKGVIEDMAGYDMDSVNKMIVDVI